MHTYLEIDINAFNRMYALKECDKGSVFIEDCRRVGIQNIFFFLIFLSAILLIF